MQRGGQASPDDGDAPAVTVEEEEFGRYGVSGGDAMTAPGRDRHDLWDYPKQTIGNAESDGSRESSAPEPFCVHPLTSRKAAAGRTRCPKTGQTFATQLQIGFQNGGYLLDGNVKKRERPGDPIYEKPQANDDDESRHHRFRMRSSGKLYRAVVARAVQCWIISQPDGIPASGTGVGAGTRPARPIPSRNRLARGKRSGSVLASPLLVSCRLSQTQGRGLP
jgi:hypothetical protein